MYYSLRALLYNFKLSNINNLDLESAQNVILYAKNCFPNDMSVFCEAVAQHFPTNFGAKKENREQQKKKMEEKKCCLFKMNLFT